MTEDFIQEIILSEVLNERVVQRDRKDPSETDSTTELELGSLPDDDILRFGLATPRYELGPKAQQRLKEELDEIILSVAEFFHTDVDWENLDEEERDQLVASLPEKITVFKSSIESAHSEVTATYKRLEDTMKLINEAHAHLQTSLSSLVAKHPPKLNSRRVASTEFLAARIEASLIKLSLLRARATQALYDHRSARDPNTSVAQALAASHSKLRAEERKMWEEEAALDRQLAEYETMLKLVDGGGGGFAQVVEDWARVQREREECVKDLRRLGWTGD
ncbi:hypothetical protein DXG01_012330 [Tephrocybe rancida]|nr:hypothetical protein DXG01_012330 [Tephrocybe rancida]